MCLTCRVAPPRELCKACRAANSRCTMHCRDAFVYIVDMTDEEKAQIIKDKYIEGGNTVGLKMGVIIPDPIMELLPKRVIV